MTINVIFISLLFKTHNYELDDALTSYAVQDAFNYRQETGRYGQFNEIDLTN